MLMANHGKILLSALLGQSISSLPSSAGSFSFITKCGLCSCLLFCSLPLLPPTRWVGRPAAFLAAGAALLLGVTLPALWWRLRRDPVSWVLGTIFDSTARAALFGFWSLCLLAAVAVVGVQPEEKKASTRVRKYFHLLIVMVHTSGVLVDPEFLYLSSIVAISFFVLLEATRVYKVLFNNLTHAVKVNLDFFFRLSHSPHSSTLAWACSWTKKTVDLSYSPTFTSCAVAPCRCGSRTISQKFPR